MKQKSISIIVILAGLLFACHKEQQTGRIFPRLETGNVTNISPEGAKFSANIKYRGNQQILSYGFVWSTENKPVLEYDEKAVFKNDLQHSGFSTTVTTTLIDSVKYHVRSFIQTSDFLVYGNEVSFFSLGSSAPELDAFIPEAATCSDTLIIMGRNFSYKIQNNVVRFGKIEAPVIDGSDSILRVKVPCETNDSAVQLSVSIQGNRAVAPALFRYAKPEFHSFYPKTGTYLDTIHIVGKNFATNPQKIQVFFTYSEAPIIFLTADKISVPVPATLNTNECKIRVISGGMEVVSAENFSLNKPVIDFIKPESLIYPNLQLEIHGQNFNPVIGSNEVMLGDTPFEVLSAEAHKLLVKAPEYIYFGNITYHKPLKMSLKTGAHLPVEKDSVWLFYNAAYTQMNDFPGAARRNAIAFAIGNKGYYGMGADNNNVALKDFWEYNPALDHWTRLADLPGFPRASAVAFVIGNTGYVGTGSEDPNGNINNQHLLKDFYAYDPASGTWTQIADFPGANRRNAVATVLHDTAYVGIGITATQNNKDFWKYDPFSNTWTEGPEFPGPAGFSKAFTYDQSVYVHNRYTLCRLDGAVWDNLLNLTPCSDEEITFVIDENVYFGLGPNESSRNIYQLNMQTFDEISIYFDYAKGRLSSASFVIDGKACFIGGFNSNGNLKDLWQFNPAEINNR